MSDLFKSNVIVALGTALSRVSGLLRVVVFGAVIGRTALADAYKLANETPNIVYELLLGGVLSATLVPLFSSFVETDDDESTNVVITVSVTLMAALTLVAVIAAPLIFRLYTLSPAAGVDAEVLRDVGTMLTRIFLIQILFYGLTGIANAFLNSRRRFFAAAWSPILPNLIIAATLLTLPEPADGAWELGDVITNDRLRWTLGLGATAGIATMALAVIPAALRTGFRFRPVWNWRHPAVRRMFTMSAWTLGFVAANQAALIVVRNLADPGSGDAAAYFDAFTFFVLPHGLLAVSIATTFQPEMSRAVARRDRTSFIRQMSLGVRMIALLTIPAGVGIFVLRRPLVGALLQHGEYGAADALATSRALGGFALGLVGFSVYLFVLRGFYAHHDTRTPFVVNVFENVINVVLAIILVDRYGVLGLGLALGLAYLVSAVWVMQIVGYKVPGFPVRDILRSLWPMLLAAALMGEVVWLVSGAVGSNSGVGAASRLVVGGLSGMAVYVGLLAVLGAPELAAARDRLPGLRRSPRQ
ncbi:MAG TPA: murein biosynthesis integral membrane protein MurJ [Ilumatobacteraceae bacterium]|nr:murein biosynthesis integral membrane protein MurJ [Ilumatobacteraceae bacterium]